MPKYIYGKDFHKNVGKTILMPHPTNPSILPVELKIISVKNKQVTMKEVRTNTEMTANYSDDKNKYLVIEENKPTHDNRS